MRHVLITGASRGIGRALALALSNSDTHLILCARSHDKLEETARDARARGATCTTRTLDITDLPALVAWIRELDSTLGGLDLIIANAGVGATSPDALSYAWETFAPALHTNFCAGAATLTAVLPQMVARRRGHLVAINSLAAFGALPHAEAYCSPKAGLRMLLDCLRLDTRDDGIAVTSVHVGFVKTEMLTDVKHPTPQLLDVDDAARHIVRRLEDRPDEIVFPHPLAFATRLFGLLPRWLRTPILARLTP